MNYPKKHNKKDQKKKKNSNKEKSDKINYLKINDNKSKTDIINENEKINIFLPNDNIAINIDKYEKENILIVFEIIEEEINETSIEYNEKNNIIDNIYEFTLGEKIEDDILV